jgi:hypothetical protein
MCKISAATAAGAESPRSQPSFPVVHDFQQRLEAEGCHVLSVMDLYGRILGFLDRSRYLFFQVALQLNS